MKIVDYLTEGFGPAPIVRDDNAGKEVVYPTIPRFENNKFRCWAIREEVGIKPDGTTKYEFLFQKEVTTPGKGASPWIKRNFFEFKAAKWFAHTVAGERVGPEYLLSTERLVVKETVGQLMGQATSFPLLCLINLAVELLSQKLSGIGWKQTKTGPAWKPDLGIVIINGDDRLAVSSKIREELFWELGASIGFAKSVKKSHESDVYCSINSQHYVRIGDVKKPQSLYWRRMDVMLLGLFYGKKKLAGEVFDPTKVITALMESCRGVMRIPVLRRFIRKFRDEIGTICAGRNLFLPICLGGMGQEAPVGWKVRVSIYQRELAEELIDRAPFTDFKHGPKWERPVVPKVQSLPWVKSFAPGIFETEEQARVEILKIENKMSICRRLAGRKKEIRMAVCAACATYYQGDQCPRCLLFYKTCDHGVTEFNPLLLRDVVVCPYIDCHNGQIAGKGLVNIPIRRSKADLLSFGTGVPVLREMREMTVHYKKKPGAKIAGTDFLDSLHSQAIKEVESIVREAKCLATTSPPIESFTDYMVRMENNWSEKKDSFEPSWYLPYLKEPCASWADAMDKRDLLYPEDVYTGD